MANKKQQRHVSLTTRLDADAAAVWKALTNAEELKRWFPLDATVKGAPDGEIQLSWGEGHTWRFRIAEAVQHKYLKLVYSHGADFQELDPDKLYDGQLLNGEPLQLVLEYFLETGEGQTALRLVHSGFGADANWDDEYNSVNRGWQSEMASLQHYMRFHPGQDRTVTWIKQVLPEDADITAVWDRLMQLIQFAARDNAYTLQLPNGTPYTGQVLILRPPLDFSGTIPALNNALLRVTTEVFGKYREISVWLSTYGLEASKVAALRQQLARCLQQLF